MTARRSPALFPVFNGPKEPFLAMGEPRFVMARSGQVTPSRRPPGRTETPSKALANVFFLIRAVINPIFSACFSIAFSDFVRFASIIGINT
ncbi:hypothetical protein HGO38_02005 [Rhizobium sp. CG5]|uniref:hypothetical protein n=1 Tax=Rhizobium sp. CG5 TaxID=2726076 RepID=UPI0020332607|nr:hypothetical protein [Rhizobium sp. CG5]MCM2472246.1 hypothetical protein [Rhizobium sp. CG5]